MLQSIELNLIDRRLRAITPASAEDDLLIVGIEESTLEALPTWGPTALDRSTYAPVISKLKAAGARAIALDVYFGDADSDAGSDRLLAAAMATAGNVVVVADAIARVEGGKQELYEFQLPTAAVAQAAVRVASPLLFRPDNIVRWVELWQSDEDAGTVYQALCLAAVEVATGGQLDVDAAGAEGRTIVWAGPSGTVPYVCFEDVYAGNVAAERIKDRIVFIGRWHQMEDQLQTPLGPMSGVEIHAQAAATLLSGKHLHIASNAVGLLSAIGLCIIVALIGVRRRGWLTLVLFVMATVLWIAAADAAAVVGKIAVPMTGTALSLIVVGVVLAAMQSERAVASLSRLWPSWVKAEGEEVEVTVLVCDLAGYTAKSEETTPAEMLGVLQEFFETVDDTVGGFGGILARRPGDAAIVFFRADDSDRHHARRGVEAALGLRDRLQGQWQYTDMGFGITLTTGIVSLGIVGTSPPEPQILGDPVNVAFRLQDETRRLDEPIIADWATANADPETAKAMRPLGKVEIRKRRAPVQIFAPDQLITRA